MKLTCSCGATGEFRDNMAGDVGASRWREDHAVCHQTKASYHEGETPEVARLRKLLRAARVALEYHQLQTRPIHQTGVVMEAIDAELTGISPQRGTP